MTNPDPDGTAVLRYRDLTPTGDSPHSFRVKVRPLTPVAPGAYADLTGLAPEQAHLVRAAAVLERMGNVVGSHATALAAWRLPVTADQLATVHVTATVRRLGRPRSRRRWYRMHSGSVGDEEIAHRCGMPVTDPVRTILDAARHHGTDWAVVACDAALGRGLVDPEELITRARAVRDVAGAARARAVPALASSLSESPGESLLRLRLTRMGLSIREQVCLDGVPGAPRVDFLVGDHLVIEFDGRSKYGLNGDPTDAWWREKRRHDRIVECGYEVLRVVWAELWDEPRLRVRVNRAVRRAGSRPTA